MQATRSLLPAGLNPTEGGLGFVAALIRFARWRALGCAGLVAACALTDGVGLLLLVPVLGVVTGDQAGRSAAGLGSRVLDRSLGDLGRSERLWVLLAAFVLVVLLRSLLLSRRDRALNRLQLAFVESLRMSLVNRLAAAPWPTVGRVRHARLVHALSVEMHQVGIAANSTVLCVVALAMLLGHALLLVVLAPAAGSLAVVFIALAGLLSWPFMARTRRLGRAITEAHFGMTDHAVRFLSGLKLAAAEGLQLDFAGRYGALADAAVRDRLDALGLQSGLRTATTVLAALAGAAALALGLLVFHLQAPVLLTLLLVLARMSAPALLVQQGTHQLLHALPAYATIRALEQDLAPSRATPACGPAAGRPNAGAGMGLALRQVAFAYPSRDRAGAAVLAELDLLIPAQAMVGVTGPSGAGKTTLLDLLAGLQQPQGGEIRVDGRPLTEPDLPGHRARLAYVAQDAPLFDDTVRRNLAWSSPGATDGEMSAALELVGATSLLDRLGAGLDSRVGERGGLVSAGERQRLALARALIRRPALLLLDEAANALDLDSEREILRRLRLAPGRPTVVTVAHRPESLEACDIILRLPHGLVGRPGAGAERVAHA